MAISEAVRPSTETRPLTIVVADDEPGFQELVDLHIKSDGLPHTIFPAQDGSEAIRIFEERHNSGEPVDLAILDFYMPGANGLEVATRARSLYPDIFIAMNTSDPETVQKKAARELVQTVLKKGDFGRMPELVFQAQHHAVTASR